MDFNVLMTRLDRFARTVHRAILVLTIFEALLVILIGVVTDGLRDASGSYVRFHVWALVFLGGLYLLLLFMRIAYDRSFPGAIADELRAERELTELRQEADRQATISQFLVSIMQGLNHQTCALDIGDDTHLCDKGITEGLSELLQPVIGNVHFLLDSQNPEALVGVYLSSYASMTSHSGDSGVIVLSDTLELSNVVTKGMYQDNELVGISLDIQTALKKSNNNFEFVSTALRTEDGLELSIHCSPMPIACDEESILGVLFIIAQTQPSVPKDLGEQMSIFNRVVANWVYRYNVCVHGRRAI